MEKSLNKEFEYRVILATLQGKILGIIDGIEEDSKHTILDYHIKRLKEAVKVSNKLTKKLKQ